jgi:hypothetical protein
MARIIPNENTWLGFVPTVADLAAPTGTELTGAVDLTPYLLSINASSQGNTVPTPDISTLFETSIAGTVQASLSADFYRDDDVDLAWTTLPRRTRGVFVISRFGGSGTNGVPEAGDVVETWPILVVSRTNANISNNTVMTFTVTGSVPEEPVEAAIVAT